jgi:DNA-binding PadR family transcriptional regulator
LLGAGTLYGAIKTLLRKKWIKCIDNKTNSRKKVYIITEAGQQTVEREHERLKELLSNGEEIIGESQ